MTDERDQWSEFLSTPLNEVAADVMQESWIGRRVGSYEIVDRLGAGGMGEVYRARDTRLGREVAIKMLPVSSVADRERIARFEIEARVLAALNDPHIGAIYDVEEARGATVLVLELVDGETLADRLERGRVPVPQAIAIATQIAEGLEAAHDKGIIHRDLKPSNIALTKSGAVKLLDFGLAKVSEPAIRTELSPAVGSREGLLGTAAYMSPEQVRAEPIDKRADIWGFGCVLYEMLTARRAFDGPTTSERIRAVLQSQPDWSALPAETPAHVRRLLRRCLEYDVKQRLHDIGDARIELQDPSAVSEAAPVRRDRRFGLFVAALAVVALVAALVAWIVLSRRQPPRAAVARFTIEAPAALPVLGDVRIAPDDSFLVYGSGGRLALRRLDRVDATQIAGTTTAFSPFISPDSRWIGYVDNFTLKKIAPTGGPPITLAPLPGLPIDPVWLDARTVIVATNNGTTGLLEVPADGGDTKVLTTVDREHGERGHVCPAVLPGGRAILFTITTDDATNAQIAMLDLESGRRTTLIRGGSDARYVRSGHLLYATAGGVSAVRFDLARGAIEGEPVRVLDGAAIDASGRVNLSISDSGTLVYATHAPGAAPDRTLVWVDRQGHEEPIPVPPRAYVGPRLSPDGSRIAVEIRDRDNDIWLWDFARHALTRLTFDPAIDRYPVWTPDGRTIIFASSRSGAFDLYSRAADGSGVDVRLTASTNSEYAAQVTADGLFVIGYEVRPRTAFDIVRFALNGDRQRGGGWVHSETLIGTAADERDPEISPSGRYIAYQSNESGQFEIYVRPYPGIGDGRWQVSTNFGKGPAWSRDGRELFFMDRTSHLMAASVDSAGETFKSGAPEMVIPTSYATPFAWRMFDVTADARRFLLIKSAATRGDINSSIVVAQNWLEEMRRLVP